MRFRSSGYVIEKRDKTGGGQWMPAVQYISPYSTSCLVPKLIEGHEYEFRVRAENEQGLSEPLSTDKPLLIKSAFGVPSRPGQPEVVDADRDFIKIRWSPPASDGRSPIKGYDIERKDLTKAGRWICLNRDPVNKLDYTDDTVIDGHQYEYRIVAKNAAGPSEPSLPSKPITAKPLKEKPKLHLGGLYDKTIRLKAGEPLRISFPLTGSPTPTVTWKCGGIDIVPTNRIIPSFKDEIVKFDISETKRSDTNKYTVTAKNAHGEDSATIDVLVYDKPGPPQGPMAYPDIKANEITIKWHKPLDDGGSEIINYRIEKCDANSDFWASVSGFCPGNQFEFKVKGLTEGKNYKFRVCAENSFGVSEPLEGLPVIAKNPFDTPEAPGQPKVTDFGRNHCGLKWTPPLNDGGRPVQGYIIEKREKGYPEWTRVNLAPVPGTEFDVPNLIEDKTYEFRVIAVNEGGAGKPSKPCEPFTARDPKCKSIIEYG